MTSPVRVLVVDDSAFMRQVLTRILSADPEIRVVDTARDGLEAVAKACSLRPDVVTLDVEMPRLDGLAALERILAECPCPVVMVSSLTQAGAATTVRALALGAVDFVAKPSGAVSLDLDRVAGELVRKVKMAARVPPERLRPRGGRARAGRFLRGGGPAAAGGNGVRGSGPVGAGEGGRDRVGEGGPGWSRPAERGPESCAPRADRTPGPARPRGADPSAAPHPAPEGAPGPGPSPAHGSAPAPGTGDAAGGGEARPVADGSSRGLTHLVAVAASTGGPGILYRLLGALPAGLAAGLVIVQHMPAGFTRALAQHLDEVSPLVVTEARNGDRLQDGVAYVAPGDYHLVVEAGGRLRLDRSPPRHGVRPAADVTFASIPAALASRTTVLVLSGMGLDGARGAKMLKDRGARVWIQDEASCVVPGMPGAVAALGIADRVGTPEQLAAWLCEELGTRPEGPVTSADGIAPAPGGSRP